MVSLGFFVLLLILSDFRDLVWIKVRDFIRSALYDPENGYFSKLAGSVGFLDKSIRFNQLQGAILLSDFVGICLVMHELMFNFSGFHLEVECWDPKYSFR